MDDKLQALKKARLKKQLALEKAKVAAALKSQAKPKKSIFSGFGKKKKAAVAKKVTWQWMDDTGWKNYQPAQQAKLEARYVSAVPGAHHTICVVGVCSVLQLSKKGA